MKKFQKLDREQMKKVLGGSVAPADCTNACQKSSDCTSGTCTSEKCPNDPNFYHNICTTA